VATASLVISLLAVVVAAASGYATWRVSRRQTAIEEHRRTDDISADLFPYVRATSIGFASVDGPYTSSTTGHLHVHNRGRADAEDVVVRFRGESGGDLVTGMPPRIEAGARPEIGTFQVPSDEGLTRQPRYLCALSWTDRTGDHDTEITIVDFTND
jgi:hypothetical protein